MFYTLGQAAKATGKSKTTISNALKSGKVSAFERTSNGYKIDASELHRVYPPVPGHETVEVDDARPSKLTPVDGVDPQDSPASKMVEWLERQHERERERTDQQIADLRQALEDMRSEKEDWKRQAQQLLLTHDRQQRSRSLWSWLRKDAS